MCKPKTLEETSIKSIPNKTVMITRTSFTREQIEKIFKHKENDNNNKNNGKF